MYVFLFFSYLDFHIDYNNSSAFRIVMKNRNVLQRLIRHLWWLQLRLDSIISFWINWFYHIPPGRIFHSFFCYFFLFCHGFLYPNVFIILWWTYLKQKKAPEICKKLREKKKNEIDQMHHKVCVKKMAEKTSTVTECKEFTRFSLIQI